MTLELRLIAGFFPLKFFSLDHLNSKWYQAREFSSLKPISQSILNMMG